MNATRDQCLELAREARTPAQTPAEWIGFTYEDIERLVHLAQRFERDRLRAQGVIWVEAVPQCTHEYEIDSDHPNHSCCQNCGEILKDGVHVQPVAQARSRAGMLAAAEKVEPVAQEPEYWAYVVNGSHTCFSATEPPEDAYDEGTLRPLYLAPPDQSAEAQREINMALDLDDARERIAELEATIEAQRTLYANASKIANENDELERQRNRLVTALQAETGKLVACEKRQEVLVEALETCTPEGFCDYDACSAALASVKGNAVGKPTPD